MAADVDSLGLCPGIGPLKARRLHAAFSSSFIKQTKSSSKRLMEQETKTATEQPVAQTSRTSDSHIKPDTNAARITDDDMDHL